MGFLKDFGKWAGKASASSKKPAPPPAGESKGLVKKESPGLIPIEPQALVPKKDPWAIWAQKSDIVEAKPKESAFSIWAPPPEQKGGMVPAPPQPPGGEVDPFSVWASKEKPTSLTDALVPRGEAGSLFQPEPDPFQPEPGRTAPKAKRKTEREGEDGPGTVDWGGVHVRSKPEPKSKQKRKVWEPPSVDEMAKILASIFDLDDVWDAAREAHDDESFIAELESGENEFGGDEARIELQTIVGMDGGDNDHGGTYIEEMFDFFGISLVEIDDYIQAWEAEEYDMGEAQEDVLEDIDFPLRVTVSEAFQKLKPRDIRGQFEILDYHEGLINLCYTEHEENYSPAEFKKLVAGAQKAREDVQARHLESILARKNEIKKFLGAWTVPSADKMVSFLESKLDLRRLITDIRKAKKTKEWRDGVAESGEGKFIIKMFGDYADPESTEKAAYFLGVPELLIRRSLENNDDHEMLWKEVLEPIDNALVTAFERILPKDLHGAINIYEDDGGVLVLGYHEYEA